MITLGAKLVYYRSGSLHITTHKKPQHNRTGMCKTKLKQECCRGCSIVTLLQYEEQTMYVFNDT